MDKRTRVLNAMDQKPVDHVPVGFWFHFGGEEAKGEACIQAHIRYYKETDLDVVKIMCDNYFPYPFSCRIEKAEDWFNVKPLGADHPYIREQVERAAGIVKELGKDRCVFYNVFAPFSSIRFSYPDDMVMRHLRENPAAVMHALDVVAQDHALLAELLITKAGCDGIYLPVQGGEFGRFTDEEYHKWISPSELYVLEHANRFSDYNILHCCGWAGAPNNVKLWQNYPAKVINWATWVEKMDLQQGRAFFGNKASLGGFETLWEGDKCEGVIYHGTKEELQDYTRELILNHGKIGLLLGGDCTISSALPWERIRWIVEAARSI